MAVSNDEDRVLLDAYAEATSPSSAEVERALTRTLARIDGDERRARLPDRRRRFVWVAAAGLATLAIASAAVAGVRWSRARSQPTAETYGAARLDRDEPTRARASQQRPAVEPAPSEPALTEPEPPELAPAPDLLQPSDAEPVADDQRSTRRRARSNPAPAPAPSDPPPADANELAAESQLLALVRRSLRDNDFAAALDFAEQHARQHPDGSLTEERLILEAVAACRGGQRERGLAAAKQLRAQFPGTAALGKVEQACASE